MRFSGPSTQCDSPSPERLTEVETLLNATWTGSGSTPFIVDIQPDPGLLEEASSIARAVPLWRLFNIAPTLAVWAVLRPLALSYGEATNDVYLHISRFVGERHDDPKAREDLKTRFRRTARNLGLPVSGNDPTNLFFAPLGPAHAQHQDLARAFVGAALDLGPRPSRTQPRRASGSAAPSRNAVQASPGFARRYPSTPQPISPAASKPGAGTPLRSAKPRGQLFAAYDGAAKAMGRTRADIIGPPRLFWADDRLGLEVERSRQPQSLRIGARSRPGSPAGIVFGLNLHGP